MSVKQNSPLVTGALAVVREHQQWMRRSHNVAGRRDLDYWMDAIGRPHLKIRTHAGYRIKLAALAGEWLSLRAAYRKGTP